MKIKFCGAAGEVTGSCHLITLDDGFNILLDCGLFQGEVRHSDQMNADWLFDPREIDLMILSHAHIDHSGRIPKLVKDGFKGDIYCTHATRDLSSIMLMDAAHIQEKDVEYYNMKLEDKKSRNKGYKGTKREPLFNSKDVVKSMESFIGMNYDRLVEIAPGVHLIFTDAGHILGSASVNLRIKRGGDDLRFAFTGDIGRPERPILLDPHPMIPSDVVISESTYGDRDHLEKPMEKQRFLEIIQDTCVNRKGKVIIPAFSLGRTQELVYLLDQIEHEGLLPDIPVYVDSPLAVNATEVFRAHPECFDFELHQYILKNPDPFGFNRLYYIHDVEDSKKLNDSKEPCIIISAAGMVNAGRIKHHVFNNVDKAQNTILFVGYCSPGTPGAILRDGAEYIKMFGTIKNVNAKIEIMDSFSAHGDRMEMLHFLQNQKNTSVKNFLVHGENDSREAFKTLLEGNGFNPVHLPELGEVVKI